MYVWLLVVTLLLPGLINSNPVPDATTESLVVTTEAVDKDAPTKTDEKINKQPELKSMQVFSNVSNRYAHTVVSSRYKNPAEVAQEATFSIVLPETAFITGFLMKIKDKTYVAYVKEKEEAKKEYEAAISQGLGAAHVEANARDSNRFTVSVNVEPHSKVTFNLTYEELLVRKHGRYEMVVNLHPGQPVKLLTVDVNINETKPLLNVNTPALRTGNEIIEDDQNTKNEYATITTVGDDGKCVNVHFAPTVLQQKEMAQKLKTEKKNGLAGQFVVQYDVERDPQGGEVLVNDGYFVHFFAPSELKPLPKHVVFVLDVSGSMIGKKIQQLKQAMQVILAELNPEDYFNLVEFSFNAKVWNLENEAQSPKFGETENYWYRREEKVDEPVPQVLPPAYPANPENIRKAKAIINKMEAYGGTNIYDSLQVGLNLTRAGTPVQENSKNTPQPIIVFLTDGDATVGQTDTKVILSMVSELNVGDKRSAIFSLSFGEDANKDFLKKLSLQNLGFMRHIYEASDAALQLQDFYKQISSPLLANVTFKYPEGQVDAVTKHTFHTLFDGGEFVVAGRMENPKDKILYVHGLTYDGPIDFPPIIIPIPSSPEPEHPVGPLERLWAYLTIKQLLDKKDELEGTEKNKTEVEELKKQAFKLAYKYSFVTPVTSLVVVKPNETEKAVDTEEAAQRPSYMYDGVQSSIAFSAPSYMHRGAPGLPGPAGFGGAAFYPSTPLAYAPLPQFTSAIQLRPELSMDADSDMGEYEAFEEVDTTKFSTTPATSWLSNFNSNSIQVKGIIYEIGNNGTVVAEKPCNVDGLNLSGNCTLISACPKVYPRVSTFAIYEQQFFCKLEPNFAGVCCVNE